jgi:hypothetical protein
MQAVETSSNTIIPHTFRLPKQGVDPYFGLSRAMYYDLERRGDIQLIRLRDRGKTRGVTLVRYADIEAIIDKATEITTVV